MSQGNNGISHYLCSAPATDTTNGVKDAWQLSATEAYSILQQPSTQKKQE